MGSGETGVRRRTRSLTTASAAAALLVGLVLTASAVVGRGPEAAVGWALLCGVPGAGLEGPLLRTTSRQRAVLVATLIAALTAGLAAWPGGAALLAAVAAVTGVAVAIGAASEPWTRGLRVAVIVFRLLTTFGLIVVLPATETAAPALWTVAAAGTATLLTIHTLSSRPPEAMRSWATHGPSKSASLHAPSAGPLRR